VTGELSPRARAILAAAVERLIPSDETSPGAREACVARYIERSLSGPLEPCLATYEDGLAALDRDARAEFNRGFLELGAELQDRILARAELGLPSSSTSDVAEFFELLRTHVIEGMFGDPRHGGNAGLVGWRLIGYSGPRLSVVADDQQLDTPSDPEIKSIDDIEFFVQARHRSR
jgi:gluconate 2-dehydrogenase gamma chain